MSFEIYMDRLIVGGRFSLGEGNPGNAIASWNGIEWSELGGGIGGQNASIRDMEIHDGSLYVVGGFSSADGIPCSGIAKWDGLKWCCLGFDSPDGNGLFSTIQHQNSLYVGGAFKVIDTDSINSVAKWIGGSYVEACGNSTSMLEANEPPHATISLYPNPANSSFTLTLPANTSTCTLTIDITGPRGRGLPRTCRAWVTRLRTSTHLSAGLYFVEVRVKDRVEVIKLVKERKRSETSFG
ncbi:MAG: T9SS type A sorting domain-containing protein [Bacteroidetes bacterium]|nr:T9SS type A sorting domain-containing protein [Bacteroidota bacterium]